MVPGLLQEVVLRAEGVLVDVTVLDDEACDAFGLGDRQPKSELRTVVVQPDDVAPKVHRVDEGLQEFRVGVEGIAEGISGRYCTVTESGQIRRNASPAR